MKYRVLAWIDNWGHEHNVPRWLLKPFCDRYEAMNMCLSMKDYRRYQRGEDVHIP